MAEDPNNTRWTRDTTTFGQKMLRRQGWEPGQLLGAQGASHAGLLSTASSAPIKVVLKDDTMGLGAKVRQKQSDECTGLNVFKDLLGRLNGKSEDTIKQEQQVRSDLKTSLYVERKFGPMRFVKGGLLVGDQITDVLKKDDSVKKESDESAPKLEAASDSNEAPAPKKEKKDKKEKRSKKRKANDSDSLNEADEKQEKRDKKKKKSRDESAVEATAGATVPAVADDDGKEKKSKKSKKSKSKFEELTEADGEVKAKSKKSKKQKGDAADTAEADDAKDTVLEGTDATKKKKKRKTQEPSDVEAEVEAVVAPADSTATPVDSGTSTPRVMSARHYARSRNIASKKLAMADMAALNQVRTHGILTVPN